MKKTFYQEKIDPPVFESTLDFWVFAGIHGKLQGYPNTLAEYLSYKYWCLANGYNPIAGAVQPEEKAFELCREHYRKIADEAFNFLDESEESLDKAPTG